MRKYLTPVGDSLGLVLEKPILDLIGLTAEMPVEVTWDGARLVVEPIRDPDARRDPARPLLESGTDFTVRANTVPLLDELVAKFGMDNARFRALHHLPYANIEAHRKYCSESTTKFHAGGTNVQTANRLTVALGKLRTGASWSEAIDEALRQYPK